ncbi:zinc transporter ZIP13 homolog [Anabrus simplex]|uniref:zinc transporter ZIP13 homolog n=1 Tax=Anabrus simplex TaxID=316456 RepID=UPI0035A3A279
MTHKMCSVSETGADLISCQFNETSDGTIWHVYRTMFGQFIPEPLFIMAVSMLPNLEYQPWICSMIGSFVIGLSGVFPLLVIPIEEGANLNSGGAATKTLKVLLSFAVGCLLGDVFLHLLPEVWSNDQLLHDGSSHPPMTKGIWILAGLLIFIVLEKMFAFMQEDLDNSFDVPEFKPVQSSCSGPATHSTKLPNGYIEAHNNNVKKIINGHPLKPVIYANGHCKSHEETPAVVRPQRQRTTSIRMSGYLNLMANSFDNFTHGLAVGGSFLVSFPHGVLTTLAILLHEIPHEVGDFAILLRSGFTRWDAARAQLCTAFAGMFGALTSVVLSGAAGAVEARTSWILPFTAGGFLHIALVTVLPDLLKEENPKESMMQLFSLLSGIAVMGALSILVEE